MILHLLLLVAAKADCPDGWIRRHETKWCYKPVENVQVSWNQAQSDCNKNGADLVSYEDENEMIWVYNQLSWNEGSSSWRFYWMGLNDLQVQGRLEWVSTAEHSSVEYNYNNFAVDADMHDSSSYDRSST